MGFKCNPDYVVVDIEDARRLIRESLMAGHLDCAERHNIEDIEEFQSRIEGEILGLMELHKNVSWKAVRHMKRRRPVMKLYCVYDITYVTEPEHGIKGTPPSC